MKGSELVLKHLEDINSLLSIDVKATDIMKRDLAYCKWLIIELKDKLNEEVNIDELWKKFLNNYKC